MKAILYRGGLTFWALTLAGLIGLRIAGYSSWGVVTFPLWGPPVAYVAFCIAVTVLALLFVAVLFILRPWIWP